MKSVLLYDVKLSYHKTLKQMIFIVEVMGVYPD